MANEQKKPTGTDPNRQQQNPRPGSSGYQPSGSSQRPDDWSKRGGNQSGNQDGMNRPDSNTDLDRDTDLDEEDRA